MYSSIKQITIKCVFGRRKGHKFKNNKELTRFQLHGRGSRSISDNSGCLDRTLASHKASMAQREIHTAHLAVSPAVELSRGL